MVKVVNMNRHRLVRVGIIAKTLIAVTILANMSLAEIPQVISYQGRLTDSIGIPVPDGRHELQFKIWTTPEGPGFVLWDSGPQDVETMNGLFTYLLGSSVPLGSDLFSSDTARWLGITVDDNPEGSPRIKLTSLPYAFHALRSDTAGYAATPVIAETRTVTGTTVAAGPEAGTMIITFDSAFTTIPLVYAVVIAPLPCGPYEDRTVPHWEISARLTDFTVKIWDRAGGSVLNACDIEVTYIALQIGR